MINVLELVLLFGLWSTVGMKSDYSKPKNIWKPDTRLIQLSDPLYYLIDLNPGEVRYSDPLFICSLYRCLVKFEQMLK